MTAILKLQRIQNKAAQPICGLHKFDRVSASLQDLHWLKIHERIELPVIIYKSVHGASQSYVRSLLDYNHSRSRPFAMPPLDYGIIYQFP